MDEDQESFAELFQESLKKKQRRLEPGERVTGTVVQVGAQRLLLDLGDGIDGLMELSELGPPDERPVVKVGERMEAYVTRVESRTAELVRSLGHGPAARRAIEEAATTGVPIEGTVTAVNKGGFVVEIAGTRAFCPMGQMDLRRFEDPTPFIGQKLSFRVMELRGGKDVVVSRRALLEEERARRAAVTREKLEVGAAFNGTVTSVREFGAFVDLGGIEGLLPAGELGGKPADAVTAGDPLEVVVTRLDTGKDGKERISLSLAGAQAQEPVPGEPPPPSGVQVQVGSVVDAVVDRLETFGAFVTFPGGRGLLPASETGLPRGADLRRAFPKGTALRLAVVEIREDGKIRLSRTAAEQAEERAEVEGYMAAQPRPSGKGFGTFGDLLKKK
jgi:small subunit ribosomal protein S1